MAAAIEAVDKGQRKGLKHKIRDEIYLFGCLPAQRVNTELELRARLFRAEETLAFASVTIRYQACATSLVRVSMSVLGQRASLGHIPVQLGAAADEREAIS